MCVFMYVCSGHVSSSFIICCIMTLFRVRAYTYIVYTCLFTNFSCEKSNMAISKTNSDTDAAADSVQKRPCETRGVFICVR
jgi:hypothetical protein